MDWADVAYSVHDLDEPGYMPLADLVNDAGARTRYADWYIADAGISTSDEAEAIHKEVAHLSHSAPVPSWDSCVRPRAAAQLQTPKFR